MSVTLDFSSKEKLQYHHGLTPFFKTIYFNSSKFILYRFLCFCTTVLYKEGPPFYHGSYSTVVKFVDEERLEDIPKYISRRSTWITLSGLNRLTEQVGKVS